MRSPSRPRSRLTVSILTRTSENRLAALVSEARSYADEIVIGVDASSTDGTLALAADLADVVYRFALPGTLSPARMLIFDYATSDWILTLDDDERMEESFDALLPDLLSDMSVNHIWLPRKWIVSRDPCNYLHAPPWYPNFALRLMRNDRSLVWKPDYIHSQYLVQGTGRYEERAAILHLEMLYATDEHRSRKLAMYEQPGGPSTVELYSPSPDILRRPARLRSTAPATRHRPAIFHGDVRVLTRAGLPPWGVTFLEVDMPASTFAGSEFVAEVRVCNSGTLTWSRPNTTNRGWPVLNLGVHLLDQRGIVLDQDFARTLVPRQVRPGEEVRFLCVVKAPEKPGTYLLEWDMVSEGECWFAECGSATERVPLVIRGAPAADAEP